jgi:Fe-S cluster assembly scaffold protein SufB
MTENAEPSSLAGKPAQAQLRPVRRAPADLPFTFVDRGLVEGLSSERGEPAWLLEDRLAALALFEGLPVESSQLYTPYVDLRAASLDGAAPYRQTGNAAASTADGLPEGVAGLLELREDEVAVAALSDTARAAGVRLMTLGELVATDDAFARELLEGGALIPVDEKLAELSRAAWAHGVLVCIPAGVRLEQPIVVRWAVGAPRSIIGRTLIVLGDGAEASVVEEIVASDGLLAGAQALLCATTEIRLGAHARLAMASLQETGPDQVVFQQRRADIGEAADLRWALAQLGGRLVRSRVDNVLAGDRSTVEQVEIVFGADDQLHDLTSYTRHVGRDTTGQLLSKGVLMDRARTYMKGLIQIEKTAIGTDSYLGEFGMNLSKAARAVAIPSLEIDQPDCRRAAHSSSVGPIDENQLFYLESRGIAPDDARKFIVLGFLEPVVARVPLEEAQDRLREALEAKWDAGISGTGTASAA